MRGQQKRLKAEAINEMKAKVQEEEKEVSRKQSARQLIEPRRGLPTLKDDLIRLAHLLHVEVEASDTVAILQTKVRPVVATLKEGLPTSSNTEECFGTSTGEQLWKRHISREEDRSRIHFVNMVSSGPDRFATAGRAHESDDGPTGSEVSNNDESGHAAHGEHAECPSVRIDADPRDVQSEFRPALRSNGPTVNLDEIKLNADQKIKPGVRQVITQAWEKHRRQQLAVSLDRKQLCEIMMVEWEKGMQNYMNEIFAMEFDLRPFVIEIYTDTEPIAKAAQRKGLKASDSLTFGTGWDFKGSRHREAAKQLVRILKPYVVILAFSCNVWPALQNLINYQTAGIVMVSDAALRNVRRDGSN